MGVVFEGFDPVLQRYVALKFLPERLAADPEARDRILHEARALAALDHPNVGAIYDVEINDEGRPFIVLALHRGSTLAQRVVPLPWREAVALVLEAATGLAHAHGAGVLHGDVKPANLLRNRDGVLKLVDFGLAGLAQPAALGARGLGTLEYMAPEVLRGEHATPASDVWSLAVVAFELLTGVGPFRAESEQEVVRRVLDEDPPRPSVLEVSVPDAFDAVLARALAKAVEARTATASAFAEDLGRALADAPPAPAERSMPTPRNAVRPATELVGRVEERTRVRDHLEDAACRGVLLHGLGGVGKSRLALELAFEEAARGAYEHGVSVVDLAVCTGPDDVAARMATALGHPTAPGDPWRALAAAIGAERMLLVLDDVDRIDPGWERLDALLAACPGVRVVATAHARVERPAFRSLAIGALSVPPEGATDPAAVAEFEAVRLFADVARRMQTGFVLDAASAPAVVALCRHTGGLPLAVELVASLVRAAPVASLVDAVEEDLDLLALPMPDHKTTLGVALGQSWRHLDGEARDLAERIAVFEGAFDWAAARGVADASVAALGRLVDASLLSFRSDGRYTMHPLVRRFARGHLDPVRHAETEALHGRHVLGWLAGRSGALRGPDQRAALMEVARDLADVEAAWAWATCVGDEVLLAACVDPLRLFYDRSGRVARGARTLGRADGVPVVALHLAWLRMLLGDGEAAERLADAGLDALGDEGAIHAVTGWSTLGAVAAGRGDFDGADAHFMRALEIGERLGDDALAARCLDNLASVADGAGRADEALRRYERGLALARRGANDAQVAVTLNNVGALHLSAGRTDEACEALDEALAIARRFDLDRSLPVVLTNLSEAARAVGRWNDATVYADEAARRADRIGDARLASAAWVELARAAAGRDGFEEARAALRRAVSAAWAVGDRSAAWSAVGEWASIESSAGRPAFAERWKALTDPEAPADLPSVVDGEHGDDSLAEAVAEMLDSTSGSVTSH